MKTSPLVQYTLLLVALIVVVLIGWVFWCRITLNLVNTIVANLDNQVIPSSICRRDPSLSTTVTPENIYSDDTQISKDGVQGVVIFLLTLLFFSIGAIVYLLFNNMGDFINNVFDKLVELGKSLLKGIGIGAGIKVVEIIGKNSILEKNDTILFLAADPTDLSRLRLGLEYREIQEKLQLGEYRKRFNLVTRMSVRPQDVSQALLDLKPKIVHFSGHGTLDGAICLENAIGQTHPVTPDALASLFERFSNLVECVILNACFSDKQAEAISNYIEYVVGTKQEIDDKAAIAFTIGFYQALGAGQGIEDACKLGRVQVKLSGSSEKLSPVLIKGRKYYF